MKELFLICALALPPSAGFTKRPANFEQVFTLLESYTENVLGRHPRKLMVSPDLQIVWEELWFVKAHEVWPPWKDAVFDLVWDVSPFVPNHVFVNRIIFLGLARLVADRGFIILDIHNNNWMENFILSHGFRKLPFSLDHNTIYQRIYQSKLRDPRRITVRLKFLSRLLNRCA